MGPSKRFGTGREVLRKVRNGLKAPPGARDWLGGHPKCLGRVRRSYKRSGTGWGTLWEVWDGLGDPLGGPGRVGGPSRWSGMSCEVLQKVRELVKRSSRGSGTGRGTLSRVWEGWGGPTENPRRVGRS